MTIRVVIPSEIVSPRNPLPEEVVLGAGGVAATLRGVAIGIGDSTSFASPIRTTGATSVQRAFDNLGALLARHCELVGGTAEGVTPDSSSVAAFEAPWMADVVLSYDSYFTIVRVARLDVLHAVAGVLPALRCLAIDVLAAPIHIDDAVAVLEFIARFVGRLAPEGLDGVAYKLYERSADPQLQRGLLPLSRWKVAHVGYGLACREVGSKIDTALALFPTDPDSAADALMRAAVEVRAMTAMMMVAAGMSGRTYRTDVRPTMVPPAIDHELAGSENLDHLAVRRAIGRMLVEFPGSYSELSRRHAGFADGRDKVLHADLHDLTEHAGLTYRLVGDVASLDANEHMSAVQVLRAMLASRMKTYGRYMRLDINY